MPRLEDNVITDRTLNEGQERSAEVAIPNRARMIGFTALRYDWPVLNATREKPEGDDVWRCEMWVSVNGGEFQHLMALSGPGGNFEFPDGTPVTEENWRVSLPRGRNRVARIEFIRYARLRTQVNLEFT